MRKIYTKIISICGADIPESIQIGNNVSFCHNCLGSVINANTIIEDNVRIYQNVTIGRSNPKDKSKIEINVKNGAILSAGCKVLAKGKITIGKNTIIAANAVLLQSTGDNEIWGGIPARLLKQNNLK